MVSIQSRYEIGIMREAGKVIANCHAELSNYIRPGISTLEINQFVEAFIKRNKMNPTQIGYQGYPFASCTSVNDEVCHGFPSDYRLKDGDIITVDMIVDHKGLHADSAWTFPVGEISNEAHHLLEVTKRALFIGIEQCVIGNRLLDIGEAIEQYVNSEGLSSVRDFTGHGIGRKPHEEKPTILHFGAPSYPGQSLRIRKGMTFTVEPMINIGSHEVTHDSNGWTARTADGSLSAQYEHTIAITDNGPDILTVI